SLRAEVAGAFGRRQAVRRVQSCSLSEIYSRTRGSVVEFAMVVRSEASLIVSFALRQAQRDTVYLHRQYFFRALLASGTRDLAPTFAAIFIRASPTLQLRLFCYLYRATYRSTPATTLQVIQPLEVVLRSRRRDVNPLPTPAVPSVSPESNTCSLCR
ncbi:hypothetical protein PSTT_14205, partial [Puccinia striiformis]